tara:strand:- start:22 stop:432 length:411 start_codon:yes stop_codon:yes gene_type:complete
MLLVSILAGFHGGPERGAMTAFFSGILYDSVVGAPLGLHALVYAPIAVAVSSLERRVVRSNRFTDAFGVAVAVGAGVIGAMAVGEIFGLSSFDFSLLLKRGLLASAFTTAVALPVSRVVFWAVSSGLPVTLRLQSH